MDRIPREALPGDTQGGESLPGESHVLATILDTLDALVVMLDRHGRIIRFNRACEKTTGYVFASAPAYTTRVCGNGNRPGDLQEDRRAPWGAHLDGVGARPGGDVLLDNPGQEVTRGKRAISLTMGHVHALAFICC